MDLSITSKDFKSGKLEDVTKVETLAREMHHVGDGTDRIADFDNAIVFEDVEGEYLFSYDTDGSMSARTAFNQACKSLASRFNNITVEIGEVL